MATDRTNWVRGRLLLPKPPWQVALVATMLWALSLVLIRWGATVEVVRPFAAVGLEAACLRGHRPAPDEIAYDLKAGEELELLGTTQVQGELCMVLQQHHQLGYAPWHPAFMRVTGYFWKFTWND